MTRQIKACLYVWHQLFAANSKVLRKCQILNLKKGEKELLLCVVLGGERVKGFERGGVHPASCEVMIKHYWRKHKCVLNKPTKNYTISSRYLTGKEKEQVPIKVRHILINKVVLITKLSHFCWSYNSKIDTSSTRWPSNWATRVSRSSRMWPASALTRTIE